MRAEGYPRTSALKSNNSYGVTAGFKPEYGLGSPNDLRCTAVGPWPAAVLCKQNNGVDKC